VIVSDCPEFMGVDFRVYGPVAEGDIIEIPDENADILVNRGSAERISETEIAE
jgi:DNA replication initiation complex subunit (GINS family)